MPSVVTVLQSDVQRRFDCGHFLLKRVDALTDVDGFDFSPASAFTFLLDDAAAPSSEAAIVAGALIARIGAGPFFYAGSQFESTASAAGEIELAINDIASFFGDNLGSLSATVCKN